MFGIRIVQDEVPGSCQDTPGNGRLGPDYQRPPDNPVRQSGHRPPTSRLMVRDEAEEEVVVNVGYDFRLREPQQTQPDAPLL